MFWKILQTAAECWAIILHVALTPGHVANNVDTLVRHREQRRPKVKEESRAAIFYSVTSTQGGGCRASRWART